MTLVADRLLQVSTIVLGKTPLVLQTEAAECGARPWPRDDRGTLRPPG